MFDIRVIESKFLPTPPTPGDDGKRIVRHGLADVLHWLGESVGPMPGEPTHSFLLGNHTLLVSAELGQRLRESAEVLDSKPWERPAPW